MIGDVIKQAREAKKLSQTDLAIKLHVRRQTISKWENNKTEPDLNTFFKLCLFLDIDTNVFYDRSLKKEDFQFKRFSLYLEVGFLLFTIVNIITIIFLNPTIIPVHFNSNMIPNRYGSRYEYFVFLIFAIPELVLIFINHYVIKFELNSFKVETLINGFIVLIQILILILTTYFLCYNINWSNLLIVKIFTLELCNICLILFFFINPYFNKHPNKYFGYRSKNSLEDSHLWFKYNLLSSILGILINMLGIFLIIFINNYTFLYFSLAYLLFIILVIYDLKKGSKISQV